MAKDDEARRRAAQEYAERVNRERAAREAEQRRQQILAEERARNERIAAEERARIERQRRDKK